MNTKVLLVNKEVRLLQSVYRHLADRGFTVTMSFTRDQALTLILMCVMALATALIWPLLGMAITILR